MTTRRRIRVLLCKPPLDMHSRGIMVVARALRDAGMEVVYLEASPELGSREVVKTALEEAADVIGLSILSGSPQVIAARIMACREEMGLQDVPLIIGGIVPEEEEQALKKMGVASIVRPGAYTGEIVDEIRKITRRSH